MPMEPRTVPRGCTRYNMHIATPLGEAGNASHVVDTLRAHLSESNLAIAAFATDGVFIALEGEDETSALRDLAEVAYEAWRSANEETLEISEEVLQRLILASSGGLP